MAALAIDIRISPESSPSPGAAEQSLNPPAPPPLTTLQDARFSLSSPNAFDRDLSLRRRSVDVGGLALSLAGVPLGDESTGKGWGGWEEEENEAVSYAELLSNMFTQIQSIVSMPIVSPLADITDDARKRLIRSLDSWNFEPHKLPDGEVLASTEIIFEALFRVEGMQEEINVSLVQLKELLRHLRQVYRSMNSYHNFQHALDVFQATQTFLRSAGVVPPVSILLDDSDAKWKPDKRKGRSLASLLTNKDLFALYIAAVGHDVGHPGFNNMFMKNAGAPLSLVYDHKSALERMHCAFLIPIMKQHGLGHLLETGAAATPFRKLLFETVLATDMGVHAQFMQRFKKLVEKPDSFDLTQTRLLICQALIKCADISNPSRPHGVSKHWSAALSAEWANQALLEKHLRLPISVQDSSDPVDEAKGQIFFIQAFALPLLEITTAAIPDMRPFAEQCAANAQLWIARLADLAADSQPNYPPVPYRPTSPPQPHDYVSVLPLSLPSEFFLPECREIGGDSFSLLPSVPHTSTATPSLGSRCPSPVFNGHEFFTTIAQRTHPTITTLTLTSTTSPVLSPIESLSSPTSPRSDSLPRTPGAVMPLPMSSVRAAYKDGMRRKKSFHGNRASWTGGSTTLASISLISSPLTPTSVLPPRALMTPTSAISPTGVNGQSLGSGGAQTINAEPELEPARTAGTTGAVPAAAAL